MASDLSSEDAVFTGKLFRKYYDHLVPQAIERGIFGWFLELDPLSKVCLQEKVATLSEETRQDCAEAGFDLSIVQLCLPGTEDRQLCRRFEGERVEVLGEWPKSPHIFRPIPSYQLHLSQIKQIPVELEELSGILISKVFPGPPNYDSIEDGDYPEEGWILKLDSGSKDILAASMRLDGSMGIDEIEIETEKSFDGDLQRCIGRQVICRGILRDAESAHHHTPLLLSACRLLTVPQSQFQKENTGEEICQNPK
jgi:hypothetical protein